MTAKKKSATLPTMQAHAAKASAAIDPERGVPLDGFRTDDLRILLGRVARDIITGYEGVIVQYGVFLNGCVRLALQASKLDEKGNVPEVISFDLQQLEVLPKKSPVEEMVVGRIVDIRQAQVEGDIPAEQPAAAQPGGPDRKGVSPPWSTR